MNVGEYKTAKTREIVEDAISQLVAVGLTPDGAASLLVVRDTQNNFEYQGMIRIEDKQKRKELAAFTADHAQDFEDE